MLKIITAFQGGSKATYWVLALAWMIVIFAFSNQANSGAVTETYLQDANVPVRKLAHMFEFALLAILVQRALATDAIQDQVLKLSWKTNLLALGFAVLYALSDEWHQSFVVGRSSSIYDAGVDTCGAVLGLLIAFLIRKKFFAALKY